MEPDARTAAADTVTAVNTLGEPPAAANKGLLQVNESAVTEIIEIWVEFSLTQQQVEREATLSSAVTLATRAANLLAQGEDLLINQGNDVLKYNPLLPKDESIPVPARALPGSQTGNPCPTMAGSGTRCRVHR